MITSGFLGKVVNTAVANWPTIFLSLLSDPAERCPEDLASIRKAVLISEAHLALAMDKTAHPVQKALTILVGLLKARTPNLVGLVKARTSCARPVGKYLEPVF